MTDGARCVTYIESPLIKCWREAERSRAVELLDFVADHLRSSGRLALAIRPFLDPATVLHRLQSCSADFIAWGSEPKERPATTFGSAHRSGCGLLRPESRLEDLLEGDALWLSDFVLFRLETELGALHDPFTDEAGFFGQVRLGLTQSTGCDFWLFHSPDTLAAAAFVEAMSAACSRRSLPVSFRPPVPIGDTV